jgi:hypothetical protein
MLYIEIAVCITWCVGTSVTKGTLPKQQYPSVVMLSFDEIVVSISSKDPEKQLIGDRNTVNSHNNIIIAL